MAWQRKNPTLLFLLNLFLVCGQQTALATTEELALKGGNIATADYRPGTPKLPAVLILHGFLSTRHFLTVSNLVESLANDGYTVLAPNLSLGLTRRKVSLACEAIHTHGLDDDLMEIDLWVNWLTAHGHPKIVLLGHSFGSLHGLSYALRYPNPAIKKIIAASLVDDVHIVGEEVWISQIEAAKAMLAKNDQGLREYRVSYCMKYVSPPKEFLSYAIWSQERILQSLSGLKIPLSIILGDQDKRMDAVWPEKLRKSGVKLDLIAGANHFFDNEQEFDLLESVMNALRSTP